MPLKLPLPEAPSPIMFYFALLPSVEPDLSVFADFFGVLSD
jgi:hypothetical protein